MWLVRLPMLKKLIQLITITDGARRLCNWGMPYAKEELSIRKYYSKFKRIYRLYCLSCDRSLVELHGSQL